MLYNITISDLINVKEAATAIKQNIVSWYNNYIIGISDLGYVIFTELPYTKMTYFPQRHLVFNNRDLSGVCKYASPDTVFTIDIPEFGDSKQIIETGESNCIFDISSKHDLHLTNDLLSSVEYIDKSLASVPDRDISNIIRPLLDKAKLNKAGVITLSINHNLSNSEFILLPINALPLVKNDTILINVLPMGNGTFFVRFTINKKKYIVKVYLRFLSVFR